MGKVAKTLMYTPDSGGLHLSPEHTHTHIDPYYLTNLEGEFFHPTWISNKAPWGPGRLGAIMLSGSNIVSTPRGKVHRPRFKLMAYAVS